MSALLRKLDGASKYSAQAGLLVAVHDCPIARAARSAHVVLSPVTDSHRQRRLREPITALPLVTRKGKHNGLLPTPRGAFQSEEIAVLENAFDAVWSTVVTYHPSQAQNGELKTLISEKFCSLAASGVMDAEQLRSMTLTSLQLP